MAIISQIGRKSPQVRVLIALIFLALFAGAITMVYPFLLMIAGSTKSTMDSADTGVIPAFLADETELYRKHIEGLFNESLTMMQNTYATDTTSFKKLATPGMANAALVDEWMTFANQADLPAESYTIGYVQTPQSRSAVPSNLRAFRNLLSRRYNDDISAMNRELGTEFVNWNAFYVLAENYLIRRNIPNRYPFALEFRQFKKALPLSSRYYFSPEGFFKNEYLKNLYGSDIAAYNKAHGTSHLSWGKVHLAKRCDLIENLGDKEKADWEGFARQILNLLWIRADPEAAPFYRDFLKSKYKDIVAVNRLYETNWPSFAAVVFQTAPPAYGIPMSDWDAFLQGWKDPDTDQVHMIPARMLSIDSSEFSFRAGLQQKYSSLAQMNSSLGTTFVSWEDVLPPQAETHYLAFKSQISALRREFTWRNYASVLDYMLLHGRGIANTAIYCLLSILASLIVNPLAAYALSRYRPPSAYKVLLFLMLTMSFPPMVTQIPAFMMLREFNLLNTFWALILPGLANGYAIFLLKGFFDSLPRELYESAEIDGAGEFRIFWQITMSLSKPILAVIALNAFTHAYSNFMMALLICQDEQMWTLMPWLYQLQMRSCQGIVFASLVVAAIPTFFVFLFCQKIILRGIVLPVEK